MGTSNALAAGSHVPKTSPSARCVPQEALVSRNDVSHYRPPFSIVQKLDRANDSGDWSHFLDVSGPRRISSLKYVLIRRFADQAVSGSADIPLGASA